MPATSAPRFVVACDDYTTSPVRSREVAERNLAAIEQAGFCRLAHRIEEVGRSESH